METTSIDSFVRIDQIISATIPTKEAVALCQQHNDRFGNYYILPLSYYQHELEHLLDRFERLSCASAIGSRAAIIDNALNAIQHELMVLSIRTLIYDLHEKKEQGQLKGQDSVSRYTDYNNGLGSPDILLGLFARYPVLADLVLTKMHHAIRGLERMLDRWNNDISRLAGGLLSGTCAIRNIYFSSGDAHNGGQKVMIVEAENGEKLVYKPRGLSPEQLYNDLVGFINAQGVLRSELNIIPILNCGDYGWQQFIEYKSCESESEAERYFYRIGASLAVYHMLGCDDLHNENLVAHGEYPAVIDLETLIKNDDINELEIHVLYLLLHKHIKESVLGTMLLPLNIQHSLFDFDFGGISGSTGEKSEHWKSYLLQDEGTDNIQLSQQSVSLSTGLNRACLQDDQLEPIDYADCIQLGFLESYKLIADRADELKVWLKSLADSEIHVRQVMRATSIYARFLEASTHPKYLTSFESRRALLSKIRNPALENTEQWLTKSRYEVDAMMIGDIPYFTAPFASYDLIANQKDKISGFFRSTLADSVETRLIRFDDKELQRQLHYIRMSLSTSVNDAWVSKGARALYRPRYFTNYGSYLDYAKEIGDFLCSRAVWNESKQSCTWLTSLLSETGKLKLGPLNDMLYEGGGVVLFLTALAVETGDDKYGHVARAAVRGIEEIYWKKERQLEQPSWFNGIGSSIQLYYSLYKLTNDKGAFEQYEQFLAIAEEQSVEGEEVILDVVGGLAGFMLGLMSIYESDKSERLMKLCDKLGQRLYESLLTQSEKAAHLTGLSHGYAGFAWAMIRWGTLRDNQEHIEFGLKLIEKENSYYEQETNNWLDLRAEGAGDGKLYWCHGAPGIAIARAKSRVSLQQAGYGELLTQDTEAAIDKLLTDGFADQLDHSLCHGVFGNIDLLLELGRMLNRLELIDRAYEEADRAVDRIRNEGFRGGLRQGFDQIGFMLGLGGVGYALLRLHNPNYHSVLSLDSFSLRSSQ